MTRGGWLGMYYVDRGKTNDRKVNRELDRKVWQAERKAKK